MDGLTDPCLDTSPYCRNGGTCMFSSNTVSCSCLSGWTGTQCQEENLPDPCLSLNCPQFSECTVSVAQASCVCLQGYEGMQQYLCCYHLKVILSHICPFWPNQGLTILTKHMDFKTEQFGIEQFKFKKITPTNILLPSDCIQHFLNFNTYLIDFLIGCQATDQTCLLKCFITHHQISHFLTKCPQQFQAQPSYFSSL